MQKVSLPTWLRSRKLFGDNFSDNHKKLQREDVARTTYNPVVGSICERLHATGPGGSRRTTPVPTADVTFLSPTSSAVHLSTSQPPTLASRARFTTVF